jgi:putative tryptophan/tyrosine transport system substrate-binding protein
MRTFLLLLLILGAPIAASQADDRTYRLGQLAQSPDAERLTRDVTLPELAKLGFQEHRNLVLDARVGNAESLPALARELIETGPDAILAIGSDAIRAASEATKTVPIVVFGSTPPDRGYTTLARPSWNITGVVILVAELDGKRLDLLHQAVPTAKRIAALMLPSAPLRQASEYEMRKVATSAGLELLIFDASGPNEYSGVFAAMRAAGAHALVIMANTNFNRDVVTLAGLAIETGLPTACEWAEMARAGCLLGYGPNREELRRRVAHQLAHIFRGTSPGDIPIELPTRFDFAINLKTAKALALSVSTLTLSRADEVIE